MHFSHFSYSTYSQIEKIPVQAGIFSIGNESNKNAENIHRTFYAMPKVSLWINKLLT
ncbi:hypothetical protein CF65_01800 [Aggregatibacter actinomycetemcomitans HK1651]|nr:hypothetical protein CF65_01800 [Aggregatibacter actinomycetemcomitans HK1651]